MNIIVTGAAGFMGSWIAEELAKKHRVFGIDDYSGGGWENWKQLYGNDNFEAFYYDLRDLKGTHKIVERAEPEVLVHLAANAREGASQFQPAEVCSRNLGAYTNVLESCIKYKVKRVVLFSSMAVYGKGTPPFDETLTPNPVDVYGVNKASMEKITKILGRVHEFESVIIRPHNVFGERQSLRDKYRNVIGIFMNRIMHKEPITIYGDGEQKRAFSYITNSLPCYIKAVTDPLVISGQQEIFNIGGGITNTINEIADIVCQEMGVKDYPRNYVPERPLEVKYAWSTVEKSQRILGYNDTVSVAEGIKRMAAWAKVEGPQMWTDEKLALPSPKMPEVWR